MSTTSTRPGLPARIGLITLTALSLGLGAGACAAPAPAHALDSVGHVSGSTALIAVVADDDTVSAYVCDGPSGTGERFTGALDAERHADLRSPTGAQLSVDVGAVTAQGFFVPAGGQPSQFSTEAASGPDAGLYLADGTTGDGEYAAGWVLLNDGTQNGALRRLNEKPKRAPRLAHRGERVVLAEGDDAIRGGAPVAQRSEGQLTIAPRVPSEGRATAAPRVPSAPRSTDTAQAAEDVRTPSRPSDDRPVLAPRRSSDDELILKPRQPGTASSRPVDEDGLVLDRNGPSLVEREPAPGRRLAGDDIPLRAILEDGTTVTPRRASEPRAVLFG